MLPGRNLEASKCWAKKEAKGGRQTDVKEGKGKDEKGERAETRRHETKKRASASRGGG